MAVTATFTVGASRFDAVDPTQIGILLSIICEHCVAMNFTITGIAFGTAAQQGMLRVTLTKNVAFTAAELAHLGLS